MAEKDPSQLLFCFTCGDEVFGARQLLEGRHRGHHVATLDQGYPHLRASLEAGLKTLLLSSLAQAALLQELGKASQRLEDSFTDTLAQIDRYFARIRDYLRALQVSLQDRLKLEERNAMVEYNCEKLKIKRNLDHFQALSKSLEAVISAGSLQAPY
jgi:hypothetical protein